MDVARGRAGYGWRTAIALTLAVLVLSILSPVPLVVLPMAVLLLALPSARRGKQVALAAMLALLVLLLPPGPLGETTRGWALLIGGGFVLATLARPAWGVLPRALVAVAAALGTATVWLAISGGLPALDAAMREHLAEVSRATVEAFAARADPEIAQEWRLAAERVSELQWQVFPAILVLESLAALALAAWWAGRLRGGDSLLRLRPLREFRFPDHLVWVLISGLALVVAPVGAAATRVGLNALLVMVGLYALRGAGIILFLIGAPSLFSVLLGILAIIFLYPLIVAGAILLGVGDTWLDVRARATAAPGR